MCLKPIGIALRDGMVLKQKGCAILQTPLVTNAGEGVVLKQTNQI
jgi:hypothetical protein